MELIEKLDNLEELFGDAIYCVNSYNNLPPSTRSIIKNYDYSMEELIEAFKKLTDQEKYSTIKYVISTHEEGCFFSFVDAFETIDLRTDNDVIFKTAAFYGSFEVVKFLVKNHGVDVRLSNNFAICVISHALFNDESLDLAKFLVENGADVNARNSYPICSTVESYYININLFKFLLQSGADIHARNDWMIRYCVGRCGSEKIFDVLIENNANFRVDNDFPLRKSAVVGNVDFVKKLLQLGADINSFKLEELVSIIKKNNLKMIEFLLENGLDFSPLNNYTSQNADHNKTLNLLVAANIEYKALAQIYIECIKN